MTYIYIIVIISSVILILSRLIVLKIVNSVITYM